MTPSRAVYRRSEQGLHLKHLIWMSHRQFRLSEVQDLLNRHGFEIYRETCNGLHAGTRWLQCGGMRPPVGGPMTLRSCSAPGVKTASGLWRAPAHGDPHVQLQETNALVYLTAAIRCHRRQGVASSLPR